MMIKIRKFFLGGMVGYSILFLVFQGNCAIPQSPQGQVSDFAGVIEQNMKSQLTMLVQEVEQKTSAEIAIVTIPSLEGADIESTAVRLYQKWGIGKKGKDNGVLILMSVQDRLVRIEVGYGLESFLPDGKCGEIIREDMIPYFKEGQYGNGIAAGTARVATLIAQDAGVTLTGRSNITDRPAKKRTLLGTIIQLLFLGGLAFLFIQNPFLFLMFLGMGGGRGGYGGGGGFGGGLSGGGGASGRW